MSTIELQEILLAVANELKENPVVTQVRASVVVHLHAKVVEGADRNSVYRTELALKERYPEVNFEFSSSEER